MRTPVMILFFNRPEPLRQVFEAVRRERPPKLFLVQDGARIDQPEDVEKIRKCREIVENVDWTCEVYRNYAQENMSCDHREFTGISWCFEHVDRLIILEDDCLPDQSFFELCDDLLEHYCNDERIHSISGFNRLHSYNTPYDYVFSKSGAGLGWATWKRAWDKVEANKDFAFLEDAKAVQKLHSLEPSLRKIYGDMVAQAKRYKQLYEQTGRVPSWEYLCGLSMLLNDMLVITPAKNTIRYLGITADATHCTDDSRLLPHKTRKVLMQGSCQIKKPYHHPDKVLRDKLFEEKNRKSMNTSKLLALTEAALLKIRYGQWKLLKQSAARRLANMRRKRI